MGNERVINILLAIDAGQNTAKINELLSKELRKFKDVRVNKIDLSLDKQDIQRKIAERIYDVFICTEVIRGDMVGGGSIKKFMEIHPHLQVILLVDPKKKSAKKLAKLFDDNSYYDALYQDNTFTVEAVHKLIVHPRTREEAFEYYGLREYVDQMQAAQQQSQQMGQKTMPYQENLQQVQQNTFTEIPHMEQQYSTMPGLDMPPAQEQYITPQPEPQINEIPKSQPQEMSFADLANHHQNASQEPSFFTTQFDEPGMKNFSAFNQSGNQSPVYPTVNDVPRQAQGIYTGNLSQPEDVVQQINEFEQLLKSNNHSEKMQQTAKDDQASSAWQEKTETPEKTEMQVDSYYEDENATEEIMDQSDKEQSEKNAISTNMAKNSITAVRARVATVINDNTLILDHPDGGCLKIAPNTKVILLLEE